MLNFYFLDKGLRIVSRAHFVYDFSTKMFLVLFLLTDQISLPGCLYFLRYWAICVLQLIINQVVTQNFKVKIIFLIEPFFLHDRKVMTKS